MGSKPARRIAHPPRTFTDAERLDWLEAMANVRGGLLLHDGSEGGRLGLGLRPGSVKRTLRQAIDTAMQPRPDPAPVRACRICGCTDMRACPGGCFWVESDLCSACAGAPLPFD